MFERYNEPARRSLFFSRYEAALLSSLTIETEHLLLGILKDRDPLIAHLVGGQPVSGCHSEPDVRTSRSARTAARHLRRDTVQHRRQTRARIRRRRSRSPAARAHRPRTPPAWLAASRRRARLRRPARVRPRTQHRSGRRSSCTSAQRHRRRQRSRRFSSLHHERAARFDGVYVMTALDGPSPGRRATTDDAGFRRSALSFSTVDFRTAADRPPDGAHPFDRTDLDVGSDAVCIRPRARGFSRPADHRRHRTHWLRFDIELRGQYDDPETLISGAARSAGARAHQSLS